MPLAEPAHPRLGSVSKRAPPIQQKPDAPRALSAMNQRVPGLSWQARVKSTDLRLCANAGISAVEILGLTSVFEPANHVRAFRSRESRVSVRFFVSRFSGFANPRFRHIGIFPGCRARAWRHSLKRRRRTSKQSESRFFATARRAAFPVMLLFRSSEKAERAPPPRRTAKRADARRVARDLIGLPEVSVGSTRARAPQARLGLRTPRAIRKASSVKFVPGDTREKTVSQTRAHRQSRVPSRTILTVRDARRDPLEPQYTRSDLSTSHVVRQRLTRETPGERAHYRRSFLFSRG